MSQFCKISVAIPRPNRLLRCVQPQHTPQSNDAPLHRSRLPLPALNPRSTLLHCRCTATHGYLYPPVSARLLSVSCAACAACAAVALAPAFTAPHHAPFFLQRTLESGQAFSQRQLEQVPPAPFLHISPVEAYCNLVATFQNRELVEIVRALQSEREGLLGELSDALQVKACNYRVAACADVSCCCSACR